MSDPTYVYKAYIDRVVDGDSVNLFVILEDEKKDFGFRIFATRLKEHNIATRLYGINAPDYRTEGREATNAATAYLQQLLPPGLPVTVHTFKNPGDKYGRWLAVIYRDGDTTSVNRLMVEAGHAVEKTY